MVEKTASISIPFPDSPDLHLRIQVGACRLKMRAHDQDAWVDGSYTDPSRDLPCKVEQEGGTVRITQERPFAMLWGWLSGVPTFDLGLGRNRPYALTIESGASENDLDLGGLPITRLSVKHGAGKMEVDFSQPNPEQMTILSVGSGAGSLDIRNLANSGFVEMLVEGGAVSYLLDFGGELRRSAHVRVSTGISAVEVRVPASTATRITTESVLGGLDVGDGFTKHQGAYCTPVALKDADVVLAIRASVALGSLRLRMS